MKDNSVIRLSESQFESLKTFLLGHDSSEKEVKMLERKLNEKLEFVQDQWESFGDRWDIVREFYNLYGVIRKFINNLK